MQELKQQAAELVAQIKRAKGAGFTQKIAEAEKAVDLSARLMVGVLAKLEELEARFDEIG